MTYEPLYGVASRREKGKERGREGKERKGRGGERDQMGEKGGKIWGGGKLKNLTYCSFANFRALNKCYRTFRLSS